MADTFYRACDADLAQGDIIDGVPHVHLRAPIEVCRRVTLPGKRQAMVAFPYPPEEGKTPDADRPGKTIQMEPFHVDRGEFIVTLSRFTRAIVLNYDCDLAHDANYCEVAIVRPITGVHEDDRQTIRENRNFNYFYLPADDGLQFDEGYADLRQVTSIDPALLEAVGKRRASLVPLAVSALQAQIFRHLTRRDLTTE